MNTYRAYVLDVTKPLAPVTHVVFVKGEKYGDAWRNGRAALNADKRSKNGALLYVDAACAKQFASSGDAFTFVRCDDMRQRNVKLDRDALRAILADPKSSEADKVKALAAMVA